MRFDVITIFPELFEPVFAHGVVGRAIRRGLVTLQVHDLRAFATDRHHQVDDAPFGGGPGMVLKPEPIFAAVEAVRPENPGPVVLLEPWGERLHQGMARTLAREPGLIIICGRYEGVDDRVRQALADCEISIGDYILSGGELPAMVLIDVVARLVPGVLGDEASLAHDAFGSEQGGYPQFTRPAEWRGLRVPDVLLSGDHAAIDRWRREHARGGRGAAVNREHGRGLRPA
ncbi:MAG TPA: tRNA (guanosine(37)-N1)-methyltransferase TrmD [Candidatus Dormibacteraeota bacterium]|nr:tRNA (guanosine(37)-N1)-methyltransferase TrmD [Candidatus Dormibacteraeota bacterium]